MWEKLIKYVVVAGGVREAARAAPGRTQACLYLFDDGRVHAPCSNEILISHTLGVTSTCT